MEDECATHVVRCGLAFKVFFPFRESHHSAIIGHKWLTNDKLYKGSFSRFCYFLSDCTIKFTLHVVRKCKGAFILGANGTPPQKIATNPQIHTAFTKHDESISSRFYNILFVLFQKWCGAPCVVTCAPPRRRPRPVLSPLQGGSNKSPVVLAVHCNSKVSLLLRSVTLTSPTPN